MPQKKATKATPSATRGRSKSAGRTPSKGRSRTPRSRSRSRVSTQKATRTPASESKIRRRRSVSPDIEPTRTSRRAGLDGSGDSKPSVVVRQHEPIPSRFSQRIVEKLETNRTHQPMPDKIVTRSEVKTCGSQNWLQCLSTLFRERICPSPLTATLSMIFSIVFMFWVNFLVFSPASSDFFAKPKFQHGKWGAGYQFIGVVWPVNWRVYFNLPSAGCILCYLSINLVLARFMPSARLVMPRNDARQLDYQCNGVLPAMLFFSVFGALQYGVLKDYGIMKPSSYVVKYWVGMLTTTSILVVLSAVFVAWRIKRVPRAQICKEGNTGNFLVDMQNGRWVRPRWCSLDWKMFVLRTSMIGVGLLHVCFGCLQWENYRRISPALAAVIVMELIQVLHYVLFERTFLSSKFVRRDGFGFACMFAVCWSLFVRSLSSYYLSSRPDIGRLTTATGELITNNVVLLCSAVLLFIVGLFIYFHSNYQINLFCRQPNHPSFYGMPIIVGLQGQSIYAGCWWGVVRHPNYLGSILMMMAMGLSTGCSSIVPWIYPCTMLMIFLHRVFSQEHTNLEEYGLPYEVYKQIVPKKLLPKLF